MFAIINESTKSYIAVESASYIYTKLPGHIKKFPSYSAALNYFDDTVWNHEDCRIEDIHRITHLGE
ncbi:hypothetical protein Ab1vBOLIVR5_gp49c [Agrobacterium phage OLIVR5]|uniref:Uncharacterized protein n=1 Tax=Agrobacterium phage OLIVR5 TaxID=2723773 RepID=A0A858MSE2_9CAUD|nr:hypothetical protein KNU99_gp049 [Agrobacterium phage OLIVR5]QIW87697.1 hypothetical protein Ab1vBOLIVR5_gp49c [Agrobacterium phage OLIVR5]QIW87959.1 hypothetical protein Ab1vBOLIVR6_gp52c [Agrobacterium phage OLIVR6]